MEEVSSFRSPLLSREKWNRVVQDRILLKKKLR